MGWMRTLAALAMNALAVACAQARIEEGDAFRWDIPDPSALPDVYWMEIGCWTTNATQVFEQFEQASIPYVIALSMGVYVQVPREDVARAVQILRQRPHLALGLYDEPEDVGWWLPQERGGGCLTDHDLRVIGLHKLIAEGDGFRPLFAVSGEAYAFEYHSTAAPDLLVARVLEVAGRSDWQRRADIDAAMQFRRFYAGESQGWAQLRVRCDPQTHLVRVAWAADGWEGGDKDDTWLGRDLWPLLR